MSFRLSDLNAITSSINTDILHLRTVGGLDKKITNTNLFNTIPTLTTFGQTILTSVSGQVQIGGGGADASYKAIIGGNLKLESSIEEPYILYRNIGVFAWAVGVKDTNAFTFNTGSIAGTEIMRLTSTEKVLIGTNVDSGPRLVVRGFGTLNPAYSGNTKLAIVNNANTNSGVELSLIGGTIGSSVLNFGDADDENPGYISYAHSSNVMLFGTNAGEAMRLTAANHLLVNTTSDLGEGLHVGAGGMRVTGTLGAFIVTADGATATFTRGGINNLWGTVSGSSIRVGTNGRALTDANSNILLNADQSVTVNTTLLVDTITEKTASAGTTFSNSIIDRNSKIVIAPKINARVAQSGGTFNLVTLDIGQTSYQAVENTSGVANVVIESPLTGTYYIQYVTEDSSNAVDCDGDEFASDVTVKIAPLLSTTVITYYRIS